MRGHLGFRAYCLAGDSGTFFQSKPFSLYRLATLLKCEPRSHMPTSSAMKITSVLKPPGKNGQRVALLPALP